MKSRALTVALALCSALGCKPASEKADGGLAARDVLTYHNDNARTGQYLVETQLAPDNVSTATFGKLFVQPVDGKVDAQPLYVSGVNIAGRGLHNVVFVATEHDSLYAIDADSNEGENAEPLWRATLLGEGEVPSDDRGCNQVTPEIGVTATPVIDRASGTIYLVAMSKKGSHYFHCLHAIDLVTGQPRPGSPVTIEATYPGTGSNSSGGTVLFDPAAYKERSALLLLDGTVYTSWASHCDQAPYTGWVLGHDATTLAPKGVLNITPNGHEGAFWNSGAGPAADETGNLFLISANGSFETTLTPAGLPNKGDYGNTVIKVSPRDGLVVSDYFAPFDTVAQTLVDSDLGSGGPLVLPDSVGSAGHRRLLVGAGKDHHIYLLDRDSLGHYNPSDNAQIVQDLPSALGVKSGEFGAPAYFNGAVYFGAIFDRLKRFAISEARLSATPVSQSAAGFGYPGTSPSISAAPSDPEATGIVWAHQNGDPAILHAFAASDLSRELYNSNQAEGGRDHFGTGNKFIVPTVANGKVYVGTTDGLAVFGLLP